MRATAVLLSSSDLRPLSGRSGVQKSPLSKLFAHKCQGGHDNFQRISVSVFDCAQVFFRRFFRAQVFSQKWNQHGHVRWYTLPFALS